MSEVLSDVRSCHVSRITGPRMSCRPSSPIKLEAQDHLRETQCPCQRRPGPVGDGGGPEFTLPPGYLDGEAWTLAVKERKETST